MPCPEGTVAHREGESKCRMCGVGRGSGNGISCFPCNSRSFNDGTFSECVRCPPGFESDSIRGASACVPCKRGFGLGRAGNACSKCKKGENVPNPRPRCIQGGTPCPSGFFETSDGVCRRCRIGERFDSRLEICVKCPPNKVSTGGLDEECRRCTFDRRSDSVFGCVCNDGFETLPSGECRICPAGTRYERSSSDAPLGACVKCPPGTYAGGEGMRFCKRCPQGYVQPKTGQKACVKCPNGLIASNLEREEYPFTLDRAYGDGERFSVSRGLLSAEDGAIFARSECVDKKTNCPGRSRRIVDQKGRFYCEPRSCPRNSFEATVGASGFSKKVKICLSCESGRFLDKKRATCVQCTQGRRSGGGVQESCTSCPGLTQSTHDFSAVEECACYSGNVTTGFLSLRRDVGAVGIVDGKCRECPRGTFGTLRSAVCVKCPKGQVQTNVGQFECSFCESGFFSDVEGATRCKKCPDGTTTYGLGDAECVQIGGQA